MSNDNLIAEVDDELRRDYVRKLWRQGGPFVIGAAVLLVLGVGGYEGWNWWQKSQSSRSSDQFYAAAQVADGTDLAAAQKSLDDVIAQGSGGYPMLAKFREAALLSQNGKIDEAVADYDGLSTSLDNTHLRELALILAGNLLIDKGDVSAVQQRVGGSLTPESPLRNAAREVMGLTQYKAGKLDDAMASFQAIINDPLATQDLRNRVQIYQLQLLAEGAKPPAPPADTTTSSAPSTEASSAASSSAASAETSSAPASAEVSASAASSDASMAVDASTELDVTPPVVVDDNALSLAMPEASSAAVSSEPLAISSEAAPSLSESAAVSSAPVASSSAP